jgi:nicotinamidase/pyrazinamidase
MHKISKNELTASIEVDPQKGFTPICPNELPVFNGHLIVDELNRQALKTTFRIFSKDIHPENAIHIATEEYPQFSEVRGDYKNMDIHWNKHCICGTKGSELLDGLPKAEDYDFFVAKGFEPTMHPYSACYHDLEKKISTGLIEWLKVKGIKTVVVGGLALDYCVFETVKDLIRSNIFVIVNKSATKSIGDFSEAVNKLRSLGCEFIECAEEL